MKRRDFLKSASAAGFASVAGCRLSNSAGCGGNCDNGINLCLQWGAIPTVDDFNAKLDYLEANGYAAVEIPTGRNASGFSIRGKILARQCRDVSLFAPQRAVRVASTARIPR
jgi:hypothetical protein